MQNMDDSAVERDSNQGTMDDLIHFSDSDNDETSVAASDFPDENFAFAPDEWNHETCLQETLKIYPDIAHDFVLNLWERYDAVQEGLLRFQQVIATITDRDGYPKEVDRQATERELLAEAKPDDSIIALDNLRQNERYQPLCLQLLKDDFLMFTTKVIKDVMDKEGQLRTAYLELAKLLKNKQEQSATGHLPLVRRQAEHRGEPLNPDDPLVMAVHAELVQARQEWTEMLQEADNRRQHQALGLMKACVICDDPTPVNRTTLCDGEPAHSMCRECSDLYIKHLLSEGKSFPTCGAAGCQGNVHEQQLRAFIDAKHLDPLLRLQQQEEVRMANIEGLTECPACDYMAVCPLTCEDTEFHCANPECALVSCRLCKANTHLPLSCHEAVDHQKGAQQKRDRGRKLRHGVEEEMTTAVLRICNKCGAPFYKDEGCNMVKCDRCKNRQCYVCGENIQNYLHFTQWPGDGRCPQFGDDEILHHEAAQRAGDTAAARILAEVPEVTPEDLVVEMAEAVNPVARRARAVAQAVAHPVVRPVVRPDANPEVGEALERFFQRMEEADARIGELQALERRMEEHRRELELQAERLGNRRRRELLQLADIADGYHVDIPANGPIIDMPAGRAPEQWAHNGRGRMALAQDPDMDVLTAHFQGLHAHPDWVRHVVTELVPPRAFDEFDPQEPADPNDPYAYLARIRHLQPFPAPAAANNDNLPLIVHGYAALNYAANRYQGPALGYNLDAPGHANHDIEREREELAADEWLDPHGLPFPGHTPGEYHAIFPTHPRARLRGPAPGEPGSQAADNPAGYIQRVNTTQNAVVARLQDIQPDDTVIARDLRNIRQVEEYEAEQHRHRRRRIEPPWRVNRQNEALFAQNPALQVQNNFPEQVPMNAVNRQYEAMFAQNAAMQVQNNFPEQAQMYPHNLPARPFQFGAGFNHNMPGNFPQFPAANITNIDFNFMMPPAPAVPAPYMHEAGPAPPAAPTGNDPGMNARGTKRRFEE